MFQALSHPNFARLTLSMKQSHSPCGALENKKAKNRKDYISVCMNICFVWEIKPLKISWCHYCHIADRHCTLLSMASVITIRPLSPAFSFTWIKALQPLTTLLVVVAIKVIHTKVPSLKC